MPRHIDNYSTVYSKLFPKSRIIVITTTLRDLIIRSSSSKQERLADPIDAIYSSPSLGSILIHCFSDGGSNKAVELAEAYRRRTSSTLPCKALCLDSTPSYPHYLNYCAAFTKSLPSNLVIRFLGIFLSYIVLAIFWVVYMTFIGFRNNVICQTRERLEDTKY